MTAATPYTVSVRYIEKTSDGNVAIDAFYRVHCQEFSDNTGIAEVGSDVSQIPLPSEREAVKLRGKSFEILKVLWPLVEPEYVLLKPGEIKKIGDKYIVEKTSDGKIVLYEIVDG